MNDLPAPQPDSVEEFLRPPPPDGNESFRQTLLLQTTGLLRRRRRAKHLVLVVALAGCYAAGMLTVYFATPPAPNRAIVDWSGDRTRKERPQPNPKRALPAPKGKRPAPPEPEQSALALEWRAMDSTKDRFALYRRAGDLYLQENDVPSALRCYRGALAEAPARERVISMSDNWLFMIAKEEIQKEKSHANNGG